MFNFGGHPSTLNAPYACSSQEVQMVPPSECFPHAPYTLAHPNPQYMASHENDEMSQEALTAIASKYVTSSKESTSPAMINISTIKELLGGYKRLLVSSERTLKYLEVTKRTLSAEDWSTKCLELEKNKELLKDIDEQLGDPHFTALVRKTVNRVKSKRNSRKRKAKAWQERKKEMKEMRDEKHKKIDLWLEKMKDEVERARRAEVVKNQADLVLSEVTQKKTEAKRILGFLNSLVKLRTAKMQQLASNSRVSEHETNAFKGVIDKLRGMWAKQLKGYNLEEQGLKVMLEDAEVERVNIEERAWKENLNLWNETLFGERSFFDPLQAQPSDFDNFISVRREWDKFIVREDALLSSCIPSGWVLPVQPSNAEWAKLSSEPPF